MQHRDKSTILVVDDEPANLDILFEQLEHANFKVLIAQNGASALKRVERTRPDIIILDVRLPDMDGFELCRRLKAKKGMKQIPVIFLSALTDTVDKLAGLDLGAVDYIIKPFDATEVLARVQRHLTIHHLRRQLKEQNEHLQQANEALSREIATREQAEQQLLAQERQLATIQERERIGQELHDDLGQVMSYISLQAQTARTLLVQGEQTQAETLLAKLAQAAQNTHADLRKYILGIRDTAGAPDFFATLENYLALLRERYGLDIEMEVPHDLPDAPFGPQVEWQLLRIIQEAVTNVGKHAGVDSAQLTFQPQDEWMAVTIRDAGRGFAPHAPREREHFGLEMMRERAASIGGRLEIHSDLEQGARVTAHVPLYPLFLQKEDDWADTRGLRVMLADDHALFLEGLSTMLAARGVQVVGTARDGLEAETLALQLRPDVILMDVQMPRCDGVMATRRILAQLTTVKIVILTVAADDDTLFAALKAGASGYLLKSLDSVTLFNMLAELMRDQVVLAPGLAARVLAEFASAPSPSLYGSDEPPAQPPATPAEKAIGATDDAPLAADPSHPLTPRQIEVLRLISQGSTYKEIGTALYISERTVKYHMGQILKRLQLKSRAQVIAYAMQEGLK